ncbi:type II toxin-antitoxin system death-on-curing family toxin [Periweissella cryptocerci]|uniref:Type II toxin-antitoxin system death-on-curing family toxin n=1 Tax=Periweissella cryptocerci TaxID=2506420 RepID=A0A4P6YW70_9LACO|nr:type II toxin-antitoxin system death-on-curing family toxin [Periweissella cryptocerci]QBO37068.1 type II toxin-antitoxin system death-on-curing family toxin [Periweissella cryptocerci]
MRYLTEQDYIDINEFVVSEVGGTTFGVQSQESLEVVVEIAKIEYFGNEMYPTIYSKAAIILQKITKKHVFQDGNKRTSYESAKIFLEDNGYFQDTSLTVPEIKEFVLQVTNSKDSEEVTVIIAEWFKRHFHRL